MPPGYFQSFDIAVAVALHTSNENARGRISVFSDQGLFEKTIEIKLHGQVDLVSASSDESKVAAKSNYKVQPGDILGVFIPGILGDDGASPPVYEDPTGVRPPALGYPLPVREDGHIYVPYISIQKVAGLSIPEIEVKLRKIFTIDKKILKEPATILVSVIRKHGDVAKTKLQPSAMDPASSEKTPPQRSPRYDGRTLSEWLDEIQYERSNDRLVSAIKAVSALVHHPDNASLVDQSIMEILKLMRQYGDYSRASTPQDQLLERSWLTLTELDPSKVADHIISEIEQGNSRSRRFLLFLWEPIYEQVNKYSASAMEAEKEIRRVLAGRNEDFEKSLLEASKKDVDVAVEILFEQITQTEHQSTDQGKQVFQRGLESKQKWCVAMAVYQLAMNHPETPGLAKHAKEILLDPYDKENPIINYGYPGAIASAYLSMLAIEELGPKADALIEVAEFLDQTGFESWNQYPHYHPKLPGWEQILPVGGGMGGGGMGGFGQAVPSTKKCNFRPVILRILSAYGEERKKVLPSLLSSFARSPQALSSWKEELVKIDPSLTKPVLKIVTKTDQTGEAEGWLFDVFGTEMKSDDTPPIQYKTTEESWDNRTFALVLAKLLVPTQKRIGERLFIEYFQDPLPGGGKTIDDNYFTVSSVGSHRRIHIVLPDPNQRAGSFLGQCLEEIQHEVENKWNDVESSETLTIDLKPFAKTFDEEQAKKMPFQNGGFGGGMGGGGMF